MIFIRKLSILFLINFTILSYANEFKLSSTEFYFSFTPSTLFSGEMKDDIVYSLNPNPKFVTGHHFEIGFRYFPNNNWIGIESFYSFLGSTKFGIGDTFLKLGINNYPRIKVYDYSSISLGLVFRSKKIMDDNINFSVNIGTLINFFELNNEYKAYFENFDFEKIEPNYGGYIGLGYLKMYKKFFASARINYLIQSAVYENSDKIKFGNYITIPVSIGIYR